MLFRSRQVRELCRIVGAWYFLFIIVVVLLLGSGSWLLLRSLILNLLGLLLHVDVHVDFVIFFVGFDFLAVIDIDRQVEWLVINFLALDVPGFAAVLLTNRLAGRLPTRCVLGLWHGLAHWWSWVVIGLFFAVEVLSQIKSLPALLGKSIVVAIHFVQI